MYVAIHAERGRYGELATTIYLATLGESGIASGIADIDTVACKTAYEEDVLRPSFHGNRVADVLHSPVDGNFIFWHEGRFAKCDIYRSDVRRRTTCDSHLASAVASLYVVTLLIRKNDIADLDVVGTIWLGIRTYEHRQ